MPQLTYDYQLPAGFPGERADADAYSALTCVATAATAFGLAVAQSGSGNQCALPAAAADKIVGITMHTAREQGYQTGTTQYESGDPLPVMTKGRIFVTAEQAVAPGDPVFVRFAVNGGNNVLGALRKDADNPGAGATAVQLPGAVFRTSASAGAIAVVEINLP